MKNSNTGFAVVSGIAGLVFGWGLIISGMANPAKVIGFLDLSMPWDPSLMFVMGGAIALGHPIGASGCRVLVSLIHEMNKRDAKKGLASLCIGGGMGVALAVSR